MKLLIILFNLLIMHSYAIENRRAGLLKIIDEELRELKRLNRHQQREDPDFMLRMAELYLEKARLYKEYENTRYLSISAKKRRKVKKSSFFKTSKKYFRNAQKICQRIIRRFKGYPRRGEVFYIMAFNAKEFNEYNQAFKYFKKAVKVSPRNSDVKAKASLALADIYYNKRKYRKAIPLYEKYLKKKGNQWWTKSAYNLAWSYFRAKNFNRAISTMKEIHKLSSNKNYIDMRYQVERNFIIFFVESNRMNEGINFYKKLNGNVSKNLLKMGKRLIKQGRFSNAVRVLKEARRYKENDEEDVDIYLAEMEIYESLNQSKKYLNASKKLFEYYKDSKLNPQQKKTFIYTLKRKAGTLQKQISKDRKAGVKTKRIRRAKLVHNLFIILAKIEPEKSATHVFFAAETLYAVDRLKSAFTFYRKSMELSDKYGNRKIKKKALDGVMATLSNKKTSKAIKDKYVIEAYEDYMLLHPRSKKSFKIHQRLFTIYLRRKKIDKAEETLLEFKEKYPKSVKIQEAMLAKIIDYHKKANNKAAIRSWVGRVNSGEFKVSKKVAKRLRLMLLNMQFEKVEIASKKGNKEGAIAGYIDIYDSDLSTTEARRNAAYNAAILQHESGDIEGMHEWSLKALALMNGKQTRKFNTSFLTIAIDLFNRRELRHSAEIYEEVFKKLCRQKSKNKKIFFKNAVVVHLTMGKYEKTQELLNEAKRCGIPSSLTKNIRRDILDSIVIHKDWDKLEEWVKRFLPYQGLNPYLIHPLFLLYENEMENGDTDRANQIKRQVMRLYQKSLSKRKKIPLEGLDVVARLNLVRAEELLKSLKEIKLAFPEKTYNQLLEEKFVILNKLTTESINVLKIGSGKGIVRGYYLLTSGYDHVVKEILSFTPPGKSREYVTSFKNSMKSLVAPIKGKMMQYHRKARIQIKKHDILAVENNLFITDRLGFNVRYFLRNEGILMDRKGR